MKQNPIDPQPTNPLEEPFRILENAAKSEEAKKLTHEFVERLWTIAIAAVGLVAAFAWDRFLRELIDVLFAQSESLWVLFGYAVLMTFVAALVAINLPWVERWYQNHMYKDVRGAKMRNNNEPHIPVGKNLK